MARQRGTEASITAGRLDTTEEAESSRAISTKLNAPKGQGADRNRILPLPCTAVTEQRQHVAQHVRRLLWVRSYALERICARRWRVFYRSCNQRRGRFKKFLLQTQLAWKFKRQNGPSRLLPIPQSSRTPPSSLYAHEARGIADWRGQQSRFCWRTLAIRFKHDIKLLHSKRDLLASPRPGRSDYASKPGNYRTGHRRLSVPSEYPVLLRNSVNRRD